ncbi:MAG: sugar transferase [Pseudomonadales bacterium]
MGVLCYVVASVGVWLVGRISLDQAIVHLQISPLVALICLFATVTGTSKLHGESPIRIVRFAGRYSLILLTGMLALAYIGRYEFLSRTVMVAGSSLLFAALIVNRLFLRWWYFHGRREHPSNYMKVLIIGGGERARQLIAAYRRETEWGIDLIGILDPRASDLPGQIDGVKVLGDTRRIHEVLAKEVVDEVVICLPRSLLDEVEPIIEACDAQAICVKYLANVFDMPNGATLHLDRMNTLPILSFDPVHYEEGKLIVKRIMDLLVTIPALVLMLPFFALVVLAIKLDSKGPVFFLQDRVGMNKRIFRMIKFRSMYEDAEARMAEIEHLNEAQGPIFKISNDPRITRVGRFIRRTSIDELPQLFNVLLGDMSLVGPRPMSIRDVNKFSLSIQRRRFSVKPGLACLREVSGRSRLSFDKWLELDLKYIDEWSLWMDLKILLLLVPSVIRGDGAS